MSFFVAISTLDATRFALCDGQSIQQTVQVKACRQSAEITVSRESVKFVKSNMAELEEIWKVLNYIKEKTTKLLEENKVIREHYNELQKSLQFHVNKWRS